MKDKIRMARQIWLSLAVKAAVLLASFVFFIIITRILSKEDYGIYTIVTITLTFLSTTLYFSLPTYIMKYLPGKSHNAQMKAVSAIIHFLVLASITAIALMLVFESQIIGLLKIQGYEAIFRLMLLSVFFLLLSRTLYYVFFANKRIGLTNAFGFADEAGWALIIVLIALATNKTSLSQIFAARVVIAILIFAAAVYCFRKDLKYFRKSVFNPESRRILKTALVFSIPLMITPIFQWIVTSSDRYILNFLFNPAEVANYSYIYSLAILIANLTNVIPGTITPYFFEAWNKRLKEKYNLVFNIMLKYSFMLVIPAIVGMYVLRSEIVTTISGTKYLAALNILPFIILYPLFDFLIKTLNTVFLAGSRTKEIALATIASGLLNIGLNIALIPRFQGVGAAIATTLTYFALFIYFYIRTRRYVSFNMRFIKIQNMIIAAIIMGVTISFIHPQTVVFKILTIAAGAAIYFGVLFISKTFIKEEIEVLKGIALKKGTGKKE